MFTVGQNTLAQILRDYAFGQEISRIEELLRYHYEEHDPASKEVRLIQKITLAGGQTLVVKFKYEADVTREMIEAQCGFAMLLLENGVHTPRFYSHGGNYVTEYEIGGNSVWVTVEDFVGGEVRVVDVPTAEKTGVLLAKTHNISEQHHCHVDCPVLFDPFAPNDLFFADAFASIGPSLDQSLKPVFDSIQAEYARRMALLQPLQAMPRYAVQGDISDCNLFHCPDGTVGMFDFNRCGDNNLFCDAVMQAVFEARLMDYPPDADGDYSRAILNAFLSGYQKLRPFTPAQREYFSILCPVIDAFWGMDILHGQDSLVKLAERGARDALSSKLHSIHRKIHAASSAW